MGKILIVDDHLDCCEPLAKLLKLSGHEVSSATNGREALTQVLNQVPDVILLDLNMPEMDGPSLMQIIRSYVRLQSLPVVVFTGLSDSPLIDRAKGFKVNSILRKSEASPAEIVRTLQEALVRPLN